jgi:hypothetical protein
MTEFDGWSFLLLEGGYYPPDKTRGRENDKYLHP